LRGLGRAQIALLLAWEQLPLGAWVVQQLASELPAWPLGLLGLTVLQRLWLTLLPCAWLRLPLLLLLLLPLLVPCAWWLLLLREQGLLLLLVWVLALGGGPVAQPHPHPRRKKCPPCSLRALHQIP